MLYKICGYKGCKNIVKYQYRYCPKHILEFKKDEKVRYKEYDSRRRLDKHYVKYKQFYNSKQWKRVRDKCIADCLGIDIVHYYKTGQIIVGDKVHHIIPIDKDWSKRFDSEWLICLSERTHRRVHAEYDMGEQEYEKMKKILIELKHKFMEEFGIV